MIRRLSREHPRVLAVRRSSRTVDVLLVTLERFRLHRSGRNAALIAHYGFLSVFPLMLVATSVLGFVLQGRPDLYGEIIDSALSQLPIIGQQIAVDPAALKGSAIGLGAGLLVTLWAALKAFVMIESALDDVAEVPIDARPNLAVARLHALLGLVIIGSGQVASVVLATLVGVAGLGVVSDLLLVIAAVLTNTFVLIASFRWLCSARPAWKSAWPGALIGGILFAALQLVGTTVVARAIARASPVYGTFASVIGLLTWLSVHAGITLAAAELNRVLAQESVIEARNEELEPSLAVDR
jgi:uncharacterized BrkB/YihY/UPF0761 family membrane protein